MFDNDEVDPEMIIARDLILSNEKGISEKVMEAELAETFLVGITEAAPEIIEFGQLVEILLRHLVHIEEV